MASGQEKTHRVNVSIDKESHLGEKWEDWRQNFTSDAAAARQALRQELLETSDEPDGFRLSLHQLTILAILSGAIASLVAQSMLVFDAVVASGLTALALLVIGGVMYVYEK